MYNDITNLLQNYRHNCFTFTSKPVDQSIIDNIIETMYDLVPSKQSKVPWQLDILGPNRSFEDKKAIYNLTYNKLHIHNGKEVGRPNPQSDAPYVFIFSHKHLTSDEIGRNVDLNNNRDFEWAAASEIGFASYMLKLLANSSGLDFGFCGCIDSEFYEETQKHFNKDKNWFPELVCGIGYGSYDEATNVKNYRIKQTEKFLRPGSIPKPAFETRIIKHY